MTITPEILARSGTEDAEQAALFCWAGDQIASGRFEVLQMMHAIANGGKRDIRTAVRLKATGVKAGVSDIFLPVSRHGVHGLYIEMKKSKANGGGRVSDEQKQWGADVLREGYGFCVCYGWQEAASVLEQYLSN
jgi:hypothetical protein